MLKLVWRRFIAERLAAAIEARILPTVLDRVMSEIEAREHHPDAHDLDRLTIGVIDRLGQHRPWENALFVPKLGLSPTAAASIMAYSSCSAHDFRTPEFLATCAELREPPRFHRKLWEWVFIIHHLRRLNVVRPGSRGIVFGVGQEALPSLFARDGATIMATDAPEEIGIAAGWGDTSQYALTLDNIYRPGIVDHETFKERVSYAHCDMNNIGPAFVDFDFCWSSCCFEHLGSLEAGLDFVVNSVEQTLKPGGVACHTTELNLSSDVDTVSTGPTVLYRRQDLLRLVDRLRQRGHIVDELKIAPENEPLDFFVDVPPYLEAAHLKLRLAGFTSTSVGIVVRRGQS